MQQLPTHRELLKLNASLPDALRDRSVAIAFAKPVPIRLTEHFYRIRLTRQMLAGGEDDFFMPEISQPHRTGRQVCPSCRKQMRRVSLTTFACEQPSCRLGFGERTQIVSGPSRGVVSVRKDFTGVMDGKRVDVSFVVEFEQRIVNGHWFAVPIVNGCLLVLDRRYSPEVLAAVYRTAGQLCDQLRQDGLDIAIR